MVFEIKWLSNPSRNVSTSNIHIWIAEFSNNSQFSHFFLVIILIKYSHVSSLYLFIPNFCPLFSRRIYQIREMNLGIKKKCKLKARRKSFLQGIFDFHVRVSPQIARRLTYFWKMEKKMNSIYTFEYFNRFEYFLSTQFKMKITRDGGADEVLKESD